MRNLRLTGVLLGLGIGLHAVDRAEAASAHGQLKPQTQFNIEEGVRKPVRVPADVLRGLGQDEKVLPLVADMGDAPVPVPPKWFAASAIDLNGDKRLDLVVVPRNPRLFGANIGPMWVFRNYGRGYALALRTDALQLEVLNTRTRGFRNIRASAATARQVFHRTYRFDGESYKPIAKP
jgi:hypothetical protein